MATVMVLGAFMSCQVEEVSLDDDWGAKNTTTDGLASKGENCRRGASNSQRNEGDMEYPVNIGELDDRTCYSNYTEIRVGYKTFGNYRIAVGSNHLGSKLQPRMERKLPRTNSNVGSYVGFDGVFRIIEVGDAKGTAKDGTYIAQIKGKHTGGGGSKDPAICLFLAKPVYGIDKEGRRTQVSFDIYREQIKTRGGTGKLGREIVFLKNVKKGTETSFKTVVGFKMVDGEKVHYTNTKIGGENFDWNIPQPERGTQSGIRYGAYRVKGGKAHIQWTDTRFKTFNIE